MPDPTSLLEIGARLAVTRKALGLTHAEMDRRMGSALSNGQTFNSYETGRQRIPTHHALALCRTCNITLDWIYRGQMHSLQTDICAKIKGRRSVGRGNHGAFRYQCAVSISSPPAAIRPTKIRARKATRRGTVRRGRSAAATLRSGGRG